MHVLSHRFLSIFCLDIHERISRSYLQDSRQKYNAMIMIMQLKKKKKNKPTPSRGRSLSADMVTNSLETLSLRHEQLHWFRFK